MRLTTASNTSASNPVKMCVMPVSAASVCVCVCAVPQESHLLHSAEGHLFSTQKLSSQTLTGSRGLYDILLSPPQPIRNSLSNSVLKSTSCRGARLTAEAMIDRPLARKALELTLVHRKVFCRQTLSFAWINKESK